MILLLAILAPDELLEKARDLIRQQSAALRNYSCIETVHRARYEPLRPSHGCNPAPPILQAWRDQFRLEVTVSQGAEIFSWPGAGPFQTGDPQKIVGGGLTGTGAFAGFAVSVLTKARTESVGMDEGLAVYAYHVPARSSTYRMQGTGAAALAYEGRFWLDPETARLRRMTVVVPDPPPDSQTCRIETQLHYPAEGFLPQSTLLQLWDTDGARHENRTEYTSCRAFQAESVLKPELEPGSAPPVRTQIRDVPAGLKLTLALETPIDGESSYAGDAVTAVLRTPLSLAPAGSRVHGRIVRLEHHAKPSRYYVLGLRFHSIEIEGRRVPCKLTVRPATATGQAINGPGESREGIGLFLFDRESLVLDGSFTSDWITAQ